MQERVGTSAQPAGCHNEEPAAVVLRQALDDVGLSAVQFTTRVIETQDEAERIGFTGSPSVSIDGRDPFVEPGQLPALACRLYRDNDGGSGVPPLGPLREALSWPPTGDPGNAEAVPFLR